MWFKKKKLVSAFNGKRLVAAYSKLPFQEAPNGETSDVYHDYAFYKREGLYWCVRVGEIKVAFGMGKADGISYYVNGTFLFKRGNQAVDTWDGKNFPYKMEDGVFRLYEKELENGRWSGFTVDIWSYLKPYVKKIAKECNASTFASAIEEQIQEISKSTLEKFDLLLDRIEIEQIGNYEEKKNV